VLWLAKGLGFGGSEQLLVNAVPHLDRSRYTVEVAYVLPWKDALVGALEDQGVSVHRLGGGHPLDLRWVGRLRALVRTGDFDLVHTHMPYPAIAARLALPPGLVLVHTEHNMWDRYRRPTAWGNALTWGRNRLIIAVSEGVASSIRPLPFGPVPPVEVVVQGIDVAAASSGPVARAEARRLLDLGPDEPVVGTVGNFTAKKDQAMLLAAFATLLAAHPSARLVLVGGGPLEQDLHTHAARLGISDHVHFTGVRPDVLLLLPAFDVFALSSRFEGLPIALLEALASGLPCVATTAGGIPEVIEDGREGFLVAPGDVEAMGARLAQLIEDPAQRVEMGRAAAARGARCDIEPAVRRLQGLYDEVLGAC
jgi:glycosyltransferase involved in cell wall biosynthesis